ncbi:phosphate ABC transporter substrate-binding protein [Colwellia sp. MEBiC06753]
MNIIKSMLLFSSVIMFSAQAVTVMVHPSNADALDAKDIKKIYLGKSKKFPGGGDATPIELKEGQAKSDFLDAVVGKSESQFKAYWSKLVFTGKGQAPKSFDSDADIIKEVSGDPTLIG